jgi:hypothetical protein
MIAPKIPLVQDGQILSVGLVNSLIGRTEYAADLLRQYRLIAGDSISLEQQFDGTRVNAELVTGFKIVGQYIIGGVTRGFLYDGSVYSDIFFPGSTLTSAAGINNGKIVGTYIIGGVTRGFLYDGSNFVDIFVPGSSRTTANGINGTNIVGGCSMPRGEGYLYNGSTFTSIFAPAGVGTEAMGISGSLIVGYYTVGGGNQVGFVFNGASYQNINYPGNTPGGISPPCFTFANGIDGNVIVGRALSEAFSPSRRVFLCDANNSNFSDILATVSPYNDFPDGRGVKGSNVVGFNNVARQGNRGFIYNGLTFVDIFYPGSSETYALGIG